MLKLFGINARIKGLPLQYANRKVSTFSEDTLHVNGFLMENGRTMTVELHLFFNILKGKSIQSFLGKKQSTAIKKKAQHSEDNIISTLAVILRAGIVILLDYITQQTSTKLIITKPI